MRVLIVDDEELAVVFVTAYDEFGLKAFDVHAVDYLLKPVEPARLAEALERVLIREEGRVHTRIPVSRSGHARLKELLG